VSDVPEVTLLLPVYRAKETLDDALSDVAAQRDVDLEALIILNGPDDGSEAIARAWQARCPSIRVLHSPTQGIVRALNLGLSHAKAPLIARFDADDRMAPQRLVRQVAAMRAHPDWSLCTTQVTSQSVDGGPAGRGMTRLVTRLNALLTPEDIRAARFIDIPVVHPAVMFRREAVTDLGGYRDGHFGEDHDLWLRMFQADHVFGMVPEVLVTWRDHDLRMTRTDPKLTSERAMQSLVATHLVNGPLADRACRVWGGGKCGKRYARALHAAGATIDDIIDIDPAKIGRIVGHGVPIVHADDLGPPDGRMVLVAVAAPGAHALIAAHLEALGYQRDIDWLALR
jgi:glycosyltransferase involved in cell wall biosynthesis